MEEHSNRRLIAKPLTRAAFSPFGSVIDSAGIDPISLNEGTAQKFADLARIEVDQEGSVALSIFRARPRPLPFTLQTLEKHPLASQAFMPLSDSPYLVVVDPTQGSPSVSTTRAFRAQGQGVCFPPGLWHHPLIALDQESDFLVVDRSGPGANLVEFDVGAWELQLLR